MLPSQLLQRRPVGTRVVGNVSSKETKQAENGACKHCLIELCNHKFTGLYRRAGALRWRPRAGPKRKSRAVTDSGRAGKLTHPRRS